jgi:hypothetical protein
MPDGFCIEVGRFVTLQVAPASFVAATKPDCLLPSGLRSPTARHDKLGRHSTLVSEALLAMVFATRHVFPPSRVESATATLLPFDAKR